jgi:hypothetical protein
MIDTTGYQVDYDALKKDIDKKKLENGANKADNSYSTEFPEKRDLHVDALEIPDSYKSAFNINNPSRQFSIGNPNFIYKNKYSYKSTDTSYLTVPVPAHTNVYRKINLVIIYVLT